MGLLETALQLVFPPRCAVCDGLLFPGEYEQGVHRACRKELPFVGEHFCMHCGQPLAFDDQEYCCDCAKRYTGRGALGTGGPAGSYIVQGRAVFVYRDSARRMMYRFKYSNRREYARFLADAACERWGDWICACGVEAVIPVPMYRGKQRRRGYNQAELFAEVIAGRMGLPLMSNAVVRVRNTRPQKDLDVTERKNNLKNAFQTSKYIVQYKKVLLVDDIYTTGSTMETIAELLNSAGVERVYFLTACIGQSF